MCNNYDIALNKRQYIKGIKIKRFNSKEEAVRFCVEGHNSLQDYYVLDSLAKESMLLESSLNWIFYSRDVREYNNRLRLMVRVVAKQYTL